jgi:uncharacterized protein (DUF305 family)
MIALCTRRLAGAIAAAAVLTACSSAPSSAQTTPQPSMPEQGEAAAIAQARADSLRRPYVQADIDFMNGMIAHHAQAIVMAKWAPSHGASAQMQTLCARIINAQRDEIRTMQGWLRDRNQTVPEPDTTTGMGMMMMHGGQQHAMLMPGMLSADQMHELDQARGEQFDKLFLRYMIQHHHGAVSMVDDLFGSYGAAQDQLTFKLANDISADQTTEIARMQKMLVAVTFGVNPG